MVVLTAVGDAVVVQVLEEESERPVGEPVGLVDRAGIALPAGEYRLRVDGKGRVGRTFRFSVNLGETLAHSISIDEGRLIGCGTEEDPRGPDKKRRLNAPIAYAENVHAIELVPGKFDLIECSEKAVVCRDGASGRVRWDTAHPLSPFDAKRDPSRWLSALSPTDWNTGVVEPAVDLDGDGVRDCVVYFHKDAAFVVLSGRDGGMLWNFVPELDWRDAFGRERTVVGIPSTLDVDHDGALDLVATITFNGRTTLHSSETVRRRIAIAISGRTGLRLWGVPLDPGFTKLSGEGGAREAMVVRGGRSTVIGFVTGTRWFGLDPAGVDVRCGPIDLGFEPLGAVQHVDLDGDGDPEIMALERGGTGKTKVLHAISVEAERELWAEEVGPIADETTPNRSAFQTLIPDELFVKWPLAADLDGDGGAEILVPDEGPLPRSAGYRGVRLIDDRTGGTRWRRPMRLETAISDGVVDAVVAPDLDGDGTRDMIIVSRYRGRGDIAPLRMAFVPAAPEWVFVDALSGKDGRAFWCWHAELPTSKISQIHTPLWWGRGPDGWPMLALPLGGGGILDGGYEADGSIAEPVVHVVELSTGRERHRVPGLARAAAADLDGDGLSDLWGEVDGELRAFRGEAPEAWRALAQFDPAGAVESAYASSTFAMNPFLMHPKFTAVTDLQGNRTIDFDGDGVTDALIGGMAMPRVGEDAKTGSHTVTVRSGRDGRVVWKTHISPLGSWVDPSTRDCYALSAFPLPEGDLNGDGTPDVIVEKRPASGRFRGGVFPDLELEVLSGRTGGRLLSAPFSSGLPIILASALANG